MAEGRLQLYVDDPILTVKGSQVVQQAAVDILILWLALGIPLSWANEAFCNGHHPHVWIGVTFLSTEPGTATMSIPEAFSKSLLELVRSSFSPSSRSAPLLDAHALCGRASPCPGYPEARPFVTALFAARAASLRSHHQGLREAPPRRVATRRFRSAAMAGVGCAARPFGLAHLMYQLFPPGMG